MYTITATADSEINSARTKALQVRTATMTWQAAGSVVQPAPVPALHWAALMLLTALVGGVSWRQNRKALC